MEINSNRSKSAAPRNFKGVKLDVLRSDVKSIRIVDTDFVLVLMNGKKIVIRDGAVKSMMEPEYVIVFKDTHVAATEVLQHAGPININEIATTQVAENGTSQEVLLLGKSLGEDPSNNSRVAATLDERHSNDIDEVAGDKSTSDAAVPNSAAVGVVGGGLSSILPPWVGALGLLGAAGGGGGGASATALTVYYKITGTVVMGPVTAQVAIKAYDKSGKELYSGTTDGTGKFDFKVPTTYKGTILVVASDASGSQADYMDEATRSALSLGSAQIRAITNTDGINDQTICVTPVTELAVRALGMTAGATVLPASLTADDLTAIYQKVGEQFGIVNPLTAEIKTVVDSLGNVLSDANQYGKVLAALSGLDKQAGGGALSGLNQITTTAIVNGNIVSTVTDSLQREAIPLLTMYRATVISGHDTLNMASSSLQVKVTYSWITAFDQIQLYDINHAQVGSTHNVTAEDVSAGYVLLTVNASNFQSQGTNQALIAKVSNASANWIASDSLAVVVDSIPPTAPALTPIVASVSAAIAAAGTVSVTAEAGASVQVTFSDGTHTVNKTLVATGSAQSLSLSSTDLSALSDGTITVSAIATDAVGNASIAGSSSFVLDRLAPTAPVFVTTTDYASASTATAGAVTVTAESGASVQVTFSDGTHTVNKILVATGSAQSLSLSSTDLSSLTDGTITVSAVATDAAGNASSAGSGSFVLDRVAPAAPTASALDAASVSGSNAGITRVTTPVYNFTAEAGATATVDIGGQTYNATEDSAHTGHFQVAVTNALADGLYTPLITLTDRAGNRSAPWSGTAFRIDVTAPNAPTVAVAATRESATTAMAGAVTVTAETGASVQVIFSDGTHSISKSVTATGNAQSVGLSSTDLSALTDGTITVSAVATDPVGNASTAGSDSFVLDRIAPAVPSASGLDAVNVNASTTDVTNVNRPLYGITAETGSSVSVTVDGRTYQAIEDATHPGYFRASIAHALYDGRYVPVIAVTDAAGNRSADFNGTGFTVDTLAPSYSGLDAASASAGHVGLSRVTTPLYSIQARAGVQVSVTVNGHTYDAVEQQPGHFQALITDALGDGNYTPVLNVTDHVGGTPGHYSGATFTIDATAPNAPTVAVVATRESATTAIAGAVTVTAEAGASVQVTFSDGTHSVSKSVTATGSAQSLSLSSTDLSALTDGTITVSAVATDAAGNASYAGSGSFVLDRVAPAAPVFVTTTDYASASTATAGAVTVTAESGASVQVTFSDGTHTVNKTLTATGNAQSVGLSSTDLSSLTDGTITVSAVTTDAAGNASSAGSGSFVLDRVAPAAPTASALDGASVSGSNAGITRVTTPVYNFTAEAGATAAVDIGGQTYNATEDSAHTGHFQVAVTNALADGLYTPLITLTDRAGNSSGTVSGSAFIVDTVAPDFTYGGGRLFVSGGTITDISSATGVPLFSGSAFLKTVSVNVTETNSLASVKVVANVPGLSNSTDLKILSGGASILLNGTGSRSGTCTVSSVSWAWAWAETVNQTNGTSVIVFTPATGSATANETQNLLSSLYLQSASGATGTEQFVYTLTDTAGNIAASASQTFTVASVPTAQTTAITALSADTGTAGDFITTVASQTVSGTYSGLLRGNDAIQVSADGGSTWLTAMVTGPGTWAADGIFLSATGTLTTRVVDAAGNTSAAAQASQAYTLNSTLTQTATITAVTDAVGGSVGSFGYLATSTLAAAAPFGGDATGATSGGRSTNDFLPVISGTVSTSGQAVQVYDGNTLMGPATVSGTSWTYTPTAPLAAGKHSFRARAVDVASGFVGALSTAVDVNAVLMSGVAVTADTAAGSVITPGGVRYLMIRQDGSTARMMYVGEVQVWSSGVNVASGKTVTGGAGTVSGVTDGALGTTNGYRSATSTTNDWIQIDLGATYALDAVSIYSASTATPANTNNLAVFASANNLSGYSYGQLMSGAGNAVQVGNTGTNFTTVSARMSFAVQTATTVDTTPTLSGTLTAPLTAGETIQIYDGSTLLGAATVSGNNWTYSVGTALSLGAHTVYAKLMSGSTVLQTEAVTLNLVADTAPTITASISSVTDGVGNAVNFPAALGYALTTTLATIAPYGGDASGTASVSINDLRPVISGSISAPLGVGQAVQVYDGSTLLGQAAVSGTSWNYTPSLALSPGEHSITAKVVNMVNGAATTSASMTINETAMLNLSVTPHSGTGAMTTPSGIRYLLIKQDGSVSQAMFIGELQAWAGGVNVAAGKTVTSSSGMNAPGVVDGVLSTTTANGYKSTTNTNSEWVQIDLGATYSLDAVSIYSMLTATPTATNNLAIFASANNLSNYSYSQLMNGAGGAVQVGNTGTSFSANATSSASMSFAVANTTTVDTMPTITGMLSAPLMSGETVQIFDGSLGTTLGTATVSGTSWSYTPSTALSLGSHMVYAKLMNGSTVLQSQGTALNVVADTTPTQLATISAVTDSNGGQLWNTAVINTSSLLTSPPVIADYKGSVTGTQSTDDPKPQITGTLNAALAAGQVVQVYDGSVLLGQAAVSGTTWSYTPGSALSPGVHSFTARVANAAAGTAGTSSAAVSINEMAMSEIAVTARSGTGIPASAARYLLVIPSISTAQMGFGEVQAWSNGVNLAIGKTATASPLLADAVYYANSAANAVDGTLGTANNNGGYLMASPSSTGWWQVDLGANYALDAVTIYTVYNAAWAGNSNNLAIFASTNPLSSYSYSQLMGGAGNAVFLGNTGTSFSSTRASLTVAGSNATVYDVRPTLSGSLTAPLAPGESVKIYESGDANPKGTANVLGTAWTYTPSTDLSTGYHNFQAKVLSSTGTVLATQTLVVNVVTPVAPSVTTSIQITDNVGGNLYGASFKGALSSGVSTDDPLPAISGTLSTALGANQVLNIYDGNVLLGPATVNGTAWTYTPSVALAPGSHQFTAKVLDTVQGTASVSPSFVINEQRVTLSATAQVGANAGVLTSGAVTIDQKPSLTITLAAPLASGERVAVYDNGALLGAAIGSGLNWSFTPTAPLSVGAHALVAQVEDATSGTATSGRALASMTLTESSASLPTQTVSITSVNDAVSLNGSVTGAVASGVSTDDAQPVIAGIVNAVLAVGQQLAVYDNGAFSGYATLSGTSWSYRPSVALSTGTHALTAKVVDMGVGTASTASAVWTVQAQRVVVSNVASASGAVNTSDAAWALGSGQPTFTGTLGATLGTGEALAAYADSIYLGQASVNGTGWSYTPTTALTSGSHSLRFQVVSMSDLNSAGYTLGRADSPMITVVVDGSTPTAYASITGVIDNVGLITGTVSSGGTVDDPQPVVKGSLSAALNGANQVVQVFDGSTLLGNATVSGLNWSFQPTTALAAGNHSLSAKVVNLATQATTGSSASFTLDEQSLNLSAIVDDVGPLQGNVLSPSGLSTTNDAQVLLKGLLGHALNAGQSLHVYDGGSDLGAVSVSGLEWSLNTGNLIQGSHNLVAQIEDASRNVLVKTAATLVVQSGDPIYANVNNYALTLPGLDELLDLRLLDSTQLLKQVNLGNASNTLNLTSAAFANLGIKDAYTAASGWSGALATGAMQMVVDGATGGTVNLDTLGWTQSGTVSNGATVYNSWTHGAQQLLIDQHLVVNTTL